MILNSISFDLGLTFDVPKKVFFLKFYKHWMSLCNNILFKSWSLSGNSQNRVFRPFLKTSLVYQGYLKSEEKRTSPLLSDLVLLQITWDLDFGFRSSLHVPIRVSILSLFKNWQHDTFEPLHVNFILSQCLLLISSYMTLL